MATAGLGQNLHKKKGVHSKCTWGSPFNCKIPHAVLPWVQLDIKGTICDVNKCLLMRCWLRRLLIRHVLFDASCLYCQMMLVITKKSITLSSTD